MTTPLPTPDPLITVADLATWVQQDIEFDDPFANTLIEACSLLVREAVNQPTWGPDDAPAAAKLICAMLAKRTFVNPDAEVATTIGPISARVVEDFARTLEFTPAEQARLASLAEQYAGTAEHFGGLFTIATTRSVPGEALDDILAWEAGPLFDRDGGGWSIPWLAAGDWGTGA